LFPLQCFNNVLSTNLLQDFIRACLQYKKEDRIEAIALANHDYLKPPAQRKAGKGGQQGQQQTSPNSSGSNVTGPTSFSFANF
jgi:serine/threonine protein kinase